MEKKAKSIGVMTSDQAIQLRQLAFDAYEPDAFRPNLTRTEAKRCIAALQAKTETDGRPAARAVTMKTAFLFAGGTVQDGLAFSLLDANREEEVKL
jgi:hypothetical protein